MPPPTTTTSSPEAWSASRWVAAYLVDRIKTAENVEIWEGCTVEALHGSEVLEAVTVVGRDREERRLPAAAVFAMIGATPRTADVARSLHEALAAVSQRLVRAPRRA